MSFVEFGNFLQFREMIMGPQSSTTTYHFKVPGNEIPNWFNHQSVGSSISFWVGPGFPNLLYVLFLERTMGMIALIVMSTFPSMVEKRVLTDLVL
jgi:hypothetical protein